MAIFTPKNCEMASFLQKKSKITKHFAKNCFFKIGQKVAKISKMNLDFPSNQWQFFHYTQFGD